MSDRTPMTEVEGRVYVFISDYLAENVYPPTLTEIGEGVGLSSKATVHRHVSSLEAKGWIEIVRGGHQYRALRLVPEPA